ncbi:hypothetical protein ACJX0J_024433, partial [Zea mays]
RAGPQGRGRCHGHHREREATTRAATLEPSLRQRGITSPEKTRSGRYPALQHCPGPAGHRSPSLVPPRSRPREPSATSRRPMSSFGSQCFCAILLILPFG